MVNEKKDFHFVYNVSINGTNKTATFSETPSGHYFEWPYIEIVHDPLFCCERLPQKK